MLPATLALVDDDATFSEYLAAYLAGRGVAVQWFADSDDLLCSAQPFGFDFYVVDLMLPGIDGIEVCTQIRAESGVPIIMLTAKSDTSDVVKGLESGADDYVVKPFNPKELVARICT